jgi:hypothetical protein
MHAQQLHVEDERGGRGNHTARTARAVAHARRDDEPPLPADTHPGDALVPSLDDAPATQRKRERLAAVARAIESQLSNRSYRIAAIESQLSLLSMYVIVCHRVFSLILPSASSCQRMTKIVFVVVRNVVGMAERLEAIHEASLPDLTI